METADSPEVVIAKRLLDHAKLNGFTFQRAAPGVDGPLVGHRVGDDWVDLIHIEGFSRDCFAWRKRISSLIVSQDALVQCRVEGSALDVLNAVLTWRPGP
jgi:hypothetical protein